MGSRSCEANKSSTNDASSAVYGTEASLPYPQNPPTCPYPIRD